MSKQFTKDKLKEISRLISERVDQSIVIQDIKQFEGGYHSNGFKLTTQSGQKFFLKRVKSHDLGFEIPERQVASLLISDGMGKRSGLSPQPIGVVLDNGESKDMIAEIDNDTEIYHIQEFAEGGEDYWTTVNNRKDKKEIDEVDERELEETSRLLVKIHSVEYTADNVDRKEAVYNSSLRTIIGHPELTLMLLHDFGEDHPILPISKHGDLLGLMMELTHKWKGRTDRLSSLHGDFWGANLFFRKDGSAWIIDYSRIPWGDPGIDVGWWLSQYLWLYHETGNEYFRELGEMWLEMYETKTGDSEIRKAVSLVLGLMGIIFITPRFYPDLDVEVGSAFFDNILLILKENKFSWKDPVKTV